ncbi:MAG: hypothetical protein CMI35_02815 [Owenweeksia sp.]|nr:hypothetical protein [Owenweeksia sp.]|tara:strand:- start:1889 stop:5050 length:3162 start_codon:yes stop_codon:yes gene_type:complete
MLGAGFLHAQQSSITLPAPDLAIKFSQQNQQSGAAHFNLLKTYGGLTSGNFTVVDHTLQHSTSNLNFSYDRLNNANGAVSSDQEGANGIYLVSDHIFGKDADFSTPKTVSFWAYIKPQAEGEDSEGLDNDFIIAFQPTSDFVAERRGLVMDKSEISNRRQYVRFLSRDNRPSYYEDYSFFAPASLDAGAGWYHIVWVMGEHHQRLYVGKPNDVTYLKMDYKYFGGGYAWLGFGNQYLAYPGLKTVLTLSAFDSSIDYFDNLCIWNSELTPDQVRALHECQKANPIQSCFDHVQQVVNDDQPEALTTFSHEAGDYVMVASHREGYTLSRARRAYPPQSADAIFGRLFDNDDECDAVEVDVRLSSDNKPYIFSDYCLDYLTNTKGNFSTKTSAQLNGVKLNVPLGHDPSEYEGTSILNLVPLEELRYNVDLYNGKNNYEGFSKMLAFTIHATGDQYNAIFTQLILTARNGRWLNKLAIKGTLTKKELVSLVRSINTTYQIAVGLDDFNYIPIATDGAPGSTNPSIDNLNTLIAANDSLRLQFAQTEMQWGNGSLLEVKTATGQGAYNNVYSQVAKSMAAGMHPAVTYIWRDNPEGVFQTDDQCSSHPYQSAGGSFNYSTGTNPLVDGRVDLDFLTSNGARYIKTDNSENVIAYLSGKGLRKKLVDAEPVISEVAVPSNFTWGSVKVSGVSGIARKISDLSKIEFGTVESEQPTRKLSVLNSWNRGQNGDNNPWNSAWVTPAQGGDNGRCYCSQQYLTGTGDNANKKPINGFYLRYSLPLRALDVWASYYGKTDAYDVYINANRFDTRDPMSGDQSRTAVQKMFYGMPCTAILGPFYARSGNDMSKQLVQFRPESYPEDPPSAHDDGFIVLYNPNTGNESIVMTKYGETDNYVHENRDKVKLVLGGHVIVQDGVIPTTMPPGSGSGSAKKRVVVGVTANNEVIIMATFSEHKSNEIAQLMLYHYQCMDVFQFDSGGSVAMFSNEGSNPKPQANVYIKNGPGANEFTTNSNGANGLVNVATPPMDRPPRVDKATNTDDPKFWAYRPIPNFLGIKIKD